LRLSHLPVRRARMTLPSNELLIVAA